MTASASSPALRSGPGARGVRARGSTVPAAAAEPRPGVLRRAPSRSVLLSAAAAIAVGSFLPWVHTPIGTFSGMAGAGVWTFYAGVWLVGAVLTRRRALAAAQMAMAGSAALVLAGWQLARLVTAVGVGTWWPGVGLIAVALGGLVAVHGAAHGALALRTPG